MAKSAPHRAASSAAGRPRSSSTLMMPMPTGTRPFTCSSTVVRTSSISSRLCPSNSPALPQATTADTPGSRTKSIWRRMPAASKRVPSSLNGVNRSATTPLITSPLSTLRSSGASVLAVIPSISSRPSPRIRNGVPKRPVTAPPLRPRQAAAAQHTGTTRRSRRLKPRSARSWNRLSPEPETTADVRMSLSRK